MGTRMVAYPLKEPYAIYDKSKYEYELDARWLLKKLEERRIVKIERGN